MKQYNNPLSIFVPGNISCLFVIVPDDNPYKSGSLGVGFTINQGVTVVVEKMKSLRLRSGNNPEVFWNGEEIHIPTVESVISSLLPSAPFSPLPMGEGQGEGKGFKISISSPLPLGGGFGLSGAASLGTAYALNEYFKLKKSKLELAKIAHVAEVENKTGLGDVANEYFGGFLLKTVPSSKFKVEKIPISNIPVYVKYFSKLSTKDVLSDPAKRKLIDRAGKKALKKVQNLLSLSFWEGASATTPESIKETDSGQARMTREQKLFSQIIQISKQFALESGLLTDPQVIKTITDIESKGGHASMIMLGNGVFSNIPFKGSTKLIIQ